MYKKVENAISVHTRINVNHIRALDFMSVDRKTTRAQLIEEALNQYIMKGNTMKKTAKKKVTKKATVKKATKK